MFEVKKIREKILAALEYSERSPFLFTITAMIFGVVIFSLAPLLAMFVVYIFGKNELSQIFSIFIFLAISAPLSIFCLIPAFIIMEYILSIFSITKILFGENRPLLQYMLRKFKRT